MKKRRSSLAFLPIQQIKRSFFLTVALALMLPFAPAHGQVINFQFTNGTDTPVLNGSTWSPTISPLAYTGTTWSQLSDNGFGNQSATDLPDSNDNPTTVSFTLTGSVSAANTGSAQSLPMFYQTEYTGSEMTLTINGLQDNQSYDLYLDDAYNGDDGSIIKVGTQTQDVSGETESSFISDVNYAEFTQITPVDNSIVVTFAPDGTGQNLAVLNGFQIVEAPEPSSLALIGFSVAGLLVFSYRVRRFSREENR